MKRQLAYFECNNIYGRLANQLYPLMITYAADKRCGDTTGWKMLRNKAIDDFNQMPALVDLGLDHLIADPSEPTPPSSISHNVTDFTSCYHQRFGLDFTLDMVEEFCKETILQSPAWKRMRERNIYLDFDHSAAIHIRNGDYINPDSPFDYFDRSTYFARCFKLMQQSNSNELTDLYVLSDDNSLNAKLYGKLFGEHFDAVHFISGQAAHEDLLMLGMFKHKVLCNSTFSYWAGFIGNAWHPDSYDRVFVPSYFRHGPKSQIQDPVADHLNPLWRIQHV